MCVDAASARFMHCMKAVRAQCARRRRRRHRRCRCGSSSSSARRTPALLHDDDDEPHEPHDCCKRRCGRAGSCGRCASARRTPANICLHQTTRQHCNAARTTLAARLKQHERERTRTRAARAHAHTSAHASVPTRRLAACARFAGGAQAPLAQVTLDACSFASDRARSSPNEAARSLYDHARTTRPPVGRNSDKAQAAFNLTRALAQRTLARATLRT